MFLLSNIAIIDIVGVLFVFGSALVSSNSIDDISVSYRTKRYLIFNPLQLKWYFGLIRVKQFLNEVIIE